MEFEEPILEETPDGEVPDAPDSGADKGKPAPKAPGGDRETRRELESLRARVDELSASERYWADLAKRNGHTEEKPALTDEEEPEIDPGTPDQLVDDLTSKGIQALYKRGIPSKKDIAELVKKERERTLASIEDVVESKIQTRIQGIERWSEILAEFPELKDQQGDFYKAVIEEGRRMAGKDASLANSPVIITAAAEVIRARASRQTRQADEFDDEFTPAQRRRAQSERPVPRSEDATAGLGAQEREMLRQMKLAPKDYLAAKRQGRGM